MNKFLIVDGSSVFYRAFYAMPRLTTAKGEPTGALTGFANIILKIPARILARYGGGCSRRCQENFPQ